MRLWCKQGGAARYGGVQRAAYRTTGKLRSMDELFAGRRFDRVVIIVCVRWYLRYKLSLRNLVQIMAEHGLAPAHTTILRWVRRYVPEFCKRWNRYGTAGGRSWRVYETCIKVRAAAGSTCTGPWTRQSTPSTSD